MSQTPDRAVGDLEHVPLHPEPPSEEQKDEDTGKSTDRIFQTDYSPTKFGKGLQTLAEAAESNDQSGPLVRDSEESQDAGASHLQVKSPIFSSFSDGQLTAPGSPAGRRKSSVGHRKRSSIQSLAGLTVPNSPRQRRRSSIVSSTSKNGTNDAQQEEDDDEFGDFDDYEEGEFEDGEFGNYEEGDSLEASHGLHFPDLVDVDSLRSFTHDAINTLFNVESNTSAPATPLKTHFDQIKDHSPKANVGPVEEEEEEEDSPFMLTDRAVSLWKQLTAPPPLQPPDWKRSRIRRLFLVSLGIPVDLDEILPKMTHKKLILPSTRRHKEKKSAEDRRSRRKIPPPPEFEVSVAKQICSKSRAALEAMDERDLQLHVNTLKAHTTAASALLTYWLEQRDSAQGDKETFEAVVENLVKYHKKQKDEQKEKASTAAKKPKSRFSIRG